MTAATLPKDRRAPLLLLMLLLASPGCREVTERQAVDKLEQAGEALQEERFQEADELFYEALLLDVDQPDAWLGRGMTLSQLGEKEAARKHFQEALGLFEKQLEEEPLATQPLRGKIILLVLLNRSGEALAVAGEAARAHPDEEFGQELAQLVENMENDLGDLILPLREEESIPVVKSEESPHL